MKVIAFGLKQILRLGLAFALLLLTFAIFVTQNPKKLSPSDMVIIFGAGIDEDGLIEPSIKRAQKAAQAYHAGLAPKLFFTGGIAKNTNMSAANEMAKIAIQSGVPESAIEMEEKSYSTIQNLFYSKETIGNFPDKIILISHGFHLPRCWLTAKFFGAKETQLLSADATYRPYYLNGAYIYLREIIAWPVHIMRLSMLKIGIQQEILYQ